MGNTAKKNNKGYDYRIFELSAKRQQTLMASLSDAQKNQLEDYPLTIEDTLPDGSTVKVFIPAGFEPKTTPVKVVGGSDSTETTTTSSDKEDKSDTKKKSFSSNVRTIAAIVSLAITLIGIIMFLASGIIPNRSSRLSTASERNAYLQEVLQGGDIENYDSTDPMQTLMHDYYDRADYDDFMNRYNELKDKFN